MKFYIDEEYLTDITIHKQYTLLKNPDNPTNEDLIKILKGRDKWTSTSCEDHPEFAKLRNQLEELGYIQTQRNWWNGDTVLKPFYLNDTRFKKYEQFPCAAAIKFNLKYKREKKHEN